MPEVPLCIHCRKPIDENLDQYVVTNKDTAKSRNDWLYAHAWCQDAPWDEDLEELERRMDELARKYVDTQAPEVREEFYKLAKQLEEMEKLEKQ